MSILCVIDSLCFGGAQRQLVELATAFKNKGYEVSFLTYHHIPFFNQALEAQGIGITCIEEPNYLKRTLKMRHYIRHGNFHSVLSFLEAANFICEVAGFPHKKWQLVVGERSANSRIVSSLKLRFFRWFHFWANYVVANSESNMQLVQKANPLLPRTKCRVIYNTVNFERFKPLEDFQFRKGKKLTLVIAARIQYEKNFTGLIQALLLLSKEEIDQLHIDWYGEYDLQPHANEALQSAVMALNERGIEKVLTFHKATHGINDIIRQADAVGLFSLYEGFPNIICEAMACEKPVICTQVSDISGFLSHDTNLLCAPGRPESIKNALTYLLSLNSNQLRSIGEKNRAIALENFNSEAIVSDYLKLLSNGSPEKPTRSVL